MNPNLRPSNGELRQTSAQKRRRREQEGASSVPPYHPNFQKSTEADLSDQDFSTDSDDYDEVRPVRKRLGSEGYEVKPIDREEMLRQFILEQAAEDGRYNRYEPQPASESEPESDAEALARSRSVDTST